MSAGGPWERIGRYEIELQLGQGRDGRVLLARDPVLARQVAIKVLRRDAALDSDERRRWAARLKEGAKAAAGLRHPGIAAVHDMGDDDGAGPFVVVELSAAGSLRERLAHGRLPKGEVAQLARALGSALTHAHAAGVVHGNIKPENVLLWPTGAKLTDFAGAAATPEEDQFALAATLYEATTGTPPFADARAIPTSSAGDGARLAPSTRVAPDRPSLAPTTGPPADPPSLTPATRLAPDLRACPHIDAIFERALAVDPARRFASCDAFATALATSLDAAYGPLLTPTSQSSIVPRTTRRWQNLAAAAGVGVIFALVLLGRQPHPEGASLKSVAGEFAAAARPSSGPRTAPATPRVVAPIPLLATARLASTAPLASAAPLGPAAAAPSAAPAATAARETAPAPAAPRESVPAATAPRATDAAVAPFAVDMRK